MSTLLVAAVQDVAGGGPKATLPTTGGSNFTLGPNWGVMEFVSTASITATTNLDVTSMAAGYDYIVNLTGATFATDSVTLEARLSQSGTFNTGSSYHDGPATATSITLSGSMGNDDPGGLSVDIMVWEPNVGSQRTWIKAVGHTTDTAGGLGLSTTYGGAFIANVNACDGLRLFLSSGDWLATGKINVWRRRIS